MASATLPRSAHGGADALLRVQHEEATARVVIACDDALLGKGLRALLEGEGLRAYFVDSFARAGRFCSLEQGGPHEVVVWVLDTVGPETVATAEEFLATREAGLCLLARTVPLEHLRALVLDRPASFGVMLRGRDADAADIAAMINQVAIGALSIDESLLRQMLRPRQTTESDLTPTEQRVLDMVSSGWRNREIARRLGRSEKAIENHIGRLFAKLGLDPKLHPHIDRRVTAALLHAERTSVPLALYSQERDGRPPRARSAVA